MLSGDNFIFSWASSKFGASESSILVTRTAVESSQWILEGNKDSRMVTFGGAVS